MTHQQSIIDPYFRVDVLNATANPNQVGYAALHQDYSEDYVYLEDFPDEKRCGEIIEKRLLKHGHFGPLENMTIVFNVGYFPHSVMQQLRTHRVGISMDVQSFRFSGQRIVDVVNGSRELESVFYLRPEGFYTDRFGKKYQYTESQRQEDLEHCLNAAKLYSKRMSESVSEEHARSIIPFDVRQHFVLSLNCRSLMHILDMRHKPDAQLEIQTLMSFLFLKFQQWMPEVAEWYEKTRLSKGRLAP